LPPKMRCQRKFLRWSELAGVIASCKHVTAKLPVVFANQGNRPV